MLNVNHTVQDNKYSPDHSRNREQAFECRKGFDDRNPTPSLSLTIDCEGLEAFSEKDFKDWVLNFPKSSPAEDWLERRNYPPRCGEGHGEKW
jgi:hypothetical protein